MNPTSANLLVAATDQIAFLKIIGRANLNLSVCFKTVINQLRETGLKNFVLDLGECSTMDSTFLGVLAGSVLNSNDSQPGSGAICLQLLNPNHRIADLLENLGVDHLFGIFCGSNPAEAKLKPSSQSEVPASREEISKTCLEAHKVLMALNPENIPKFKDVAQFLAEDLKRIKSGS